MIEVKNVQLSYDDVPVLRGVNLKIEKGEVLALIGGSGKGKTVLLKTIMGLIEPDGGEVLLKGKNIAHIRGGALKRIKEQFGIVFQSGALFDSESVFNNVAFPLREKTRMSEEDIAKKVNAQLAALDLKGSEHKFPSQLSGGMQKRAALARSMIQAPEVLLLDEPTTGLDPIITNAIHKVISKLHRERGLTGMIVSHEIPDIFDIVDKVALLHEGRIHMTGTPQEFMQSEDEVIKKFLNGGLE